MMMNSPYSMVWTRWTWFKVFSFLAGSLQVPIYLCSPSGWELPALVRDHLSLSHCQQKLQTLCQNNIIEWDLHALTIDHLSTIFINDTKDMLKLCDILTSSDMIKISTWYSSSYSCQYIKKFWHYFMSNLFNALRDLHSAVTHLLYNQEYIFYFTKNSHITLS